MLYLGGQVVIMRIWAEFLEVRYSRKLDPLEEDEGR